MNLEEKQIMLFRSQYIIDNQKSIIEDIRNIGLPRFKNKFNIENNDITWMYSDYNIFSVMGGNRHFYNIFKDLNLCISDYIRKYNFLSDSVWMQSWINFHKQEEVLTKHNHGCPIHGYISIEPKDTTTVFFDVDGAEMYSIKNEIGNIYISLGYRQHEVRNLNSYEDERITIGFDVQTGTFETKNINLIPMVI
jgi:hypothetical protein